MRVCSIAKHYAYSRDENIHNESNIFAVANNFQTNPNGYTFSQSNTTPAYLFYCSSCTRFNFNGVIWKLSYNGRYGCLANQ